MKATNSSRKGLNSKTISLRNSKRSLVSNNVYDDVVNILDAMKDGKVSFKEAFSKTSIKNNSHQVYAIAIKTVNNQKQCDEIIDKSGLKEEHPLENKNLLRALITDLLWGCKRLIGQGKLLNVVKEKQELLKKLNQNYKGNPGKTNKIVYLRINTIKCTTEEFVTHLKDLKFQRIDTPKTYEEYISTLQTLNTDSFLVDYHFPDLLSFSSKVKATLWSDPFFQNNRVTIQDKSSLIPVNLLDVQPCSTVLDMCAAPGMKTVYLAGKLNGRGKVIAVDKDKKRYRTMHRIIHNFGANKIVQAFNQDISHFSCESDEIDYVLLDAPCSGSGMKERLGGTENSLERLQSLHWLQVKLLSQALTQYRSAKRIVYSTCSINVEENESVVQEALDKCESLSYKLADCHKLIQGYSQGSSEYECGSRCLRVDPDKDISSGFFVALFERIQDHTSISIKDPSKHTIKQLPETMVTKVKQNSQKRKRKLSVNLIKKIKTEAKLYKKIQWTVTEIK